MKLLQHKFSYKKLSILVLSAIAIGLSLNYANGPSSGGSRVGASFSSGTCTSVGCHTTSGSFNPSVSIQLLSGTTAVTTYTPGNSYTLRITLTGSGTGSSTRYGFQTVAVQDNSSSTAVNAWGTLPSGTQSATIGGRVHVEHSSPSTSNVFNIPWTAPSSANYDIKFYVAGIVANGNNANTFDNMATGSITISPPCTTPTITPNPSNIACFGQNTGSISLGLTGGSSPFSFAWTGPSGYSSTSQNINSLAPGSYKVIVTANGGCKDSATVTITQPSSAVAISASSNSPTCAGATLQLNSTGSGGTGSISYAWIGPNSFTSGSKDNTLMNATTSMSGVYTVIGTDNNGCSEQDTITVLVDTSAMVDSFTINANPYNVVTFMPVNIQGADSTLWIFGDGSTDTPSIPTHTYSADGIYSVQLVVMNKCGSDTFSKNVVIQPVNVESVNSFVGSLNMYPNPAFDVLNINASKGIEMSTVSMYTLSGQRIYTNNKQQGSYRIDTSVLPQGVYYIVIETNKGVYTNKVHVLR